MTNITLVRDGSNLCHVETGRPGAAGDDGHLRQDEGHGVLPPPQQGTGVAGAPPPAGACEGLQSGGDPPPAGESDEGRLGGKPSPAGIGAGRQVAPVLGQVSRGALEQVQGLRYANVRDLLEVLGEQQVRRPEGPHVIEARHENFWCPMVIEARQENSWARCY